MIASLAACVNVPDAPSDYGKADPIWGNRYGYSDKALGDDEFSVVFTASPATSKERTAQLALLRAAHLAHERGRSHFTIVREKTVTLDRHAMIMAPIGGALVWVPVGESLVKEPTAVLIIRLVPAGAAPPADAIDAAEVIRRVKSASVAN